MPSKNTTSSSTNATTSSPSSSDKDIIDKSKWEIYETKQDCGLIPTIAVTLWVGWMGILVYTIILMIIIPGFSSIKLIILGIWTSSLIVSRHFPGKSIGQDIIGKWLMINAEKYFGLKTTIEDPTKFHCNEKAYIFASEPHDILPYSVFAFNKHLKRLPGRIGETHNALMTGAIFNIPMIKQVYSWVGGAPVDKKTFTRKLQKKESFTFVPGGVQEVTMIGDVSLNKDKKSNGESNSSNSSSTEDLLLYLKNRKGFVKLAIKEKSPIVPVFVFNLDGSYNYFVPKGKLMDKISRTIGFVPVMFTGRFYIPFGIPKPQKIHVIVGSPIYIDNEDSKENVEPSSELIDKYHTKYIDELIKLYNRHKEYEGYEHRNLVIV